MTQLWRAFCVWWLIVVSVGASAQPLIIAHRGASSDAPENTLAAFELAWKQGADGIEGDVCLTADGQVVCIHDPTTGRTSGDDPGGEEGGGLVVAQSTYAQLQAIDVGAWKHERFVGQRVPLLSEALAAVPQDGHMFIEVKVGPEIVPALFEVLRDSGLGGEQLAVIAFDDAVVRACKARLAEDGGGVLAEMQINWLTNFEPDEQTLRPRLGIAEVLARLKANGADGLGCKARADVVDAAFVERLRAAGYGFHVWTVDHPTTARHFADLGVDSITTNRPARLRRQLAGDGPAEDAAQ